MEITKTISPGEQVIVEHVRPREVQAGDKVLAWGTTRELVWTVKYAKKVKADLGQTKYRIRIVVPFNTKGAPWMGAQKDPERTMEVSPHGHVDRVVS